MSRQCLDFEQPIEELNQKIQALQHLGSDTDVNLTDEIERLSRKVETLTKNIFSKLDPWQVTQMARHPLRPQTTDYLEAIFTDFQELHGDRHSSAAPAIIAGIARLDGQAVMVIGHQKGRRTKEKVYRNFGMARPEEYRRALRLMKLAEKFRLPVITFIDTAGAYPGIGAEERNQSEAIARNLAEMARLKTQIVCVVTGEAGSGGALAIGMGDRVFMLQYSIYAVISPEGCASILWKDAAFASEAAKAMGVTAERIATFNLIDGVIPEPLGGAHRDVQTIAQSIKRQIQEALTALQGLPIETLLAQRYQKYMAIGT